MGIILSRKIGRKKTKNETAKKRKKKKIKKKRKEMPLKNRNLASMVRKNPQISILKHIF